MPRKTVVKKKAHPKKATTVNARVVTFWWEAFQFLPLTAKKRLTKDGLRKRRDELEAMLEPYLTTRKTRWAVHFKGRQHYVGEIALGSNDKGRLVSSTICALQCISKIEVAREAGNIDAALEETYDFALHDLNVSIIQQCGWSAWRAVHYWGLDREKKQTNARGRAKGPLSRKGQSKLQDHKELVKDLYNKHKGEHAYMRLMLRDLADARVVVSDDIVLGFLRDLGIYEEKTKRRPSCRK
jgi:hypothetical protein